MTVRISANCNDKLISASMRVETMDGQHLTNFSGVPLITLGVGQSIATPSIFGHILDGCIFRIAVINFSDASRNLLQHPSLLGRSHKIIVPNLHARAAPYESVTRGLITRCLSTNNSRSYRKVRDWPNHLLCRHVQEFRIRLLLTAPNP